MNEYRHINMAPNPRLRPSSRSYLRSSAHHLGWMGFHLVMLDLNTYVAYRLAPETFGSPHMVGGDFSAWCGDLARVTGIPKPLVRLFWTLNLAHTNCQGLCCSWHILAVVGVATGVYLDEEWPKIMRKPFLSTSLNELWGTRYHQILKVGGGTVSLSSGHLPPPGETVRPPRSTDPRPRRLHPLGPVAHRDLLPAQTRGRRLAVPLFLRVLWPWVYRRATVLPVHGEAGRWCVGRGLDVGVCPGGEHPGGGSRVVERVGGDDAGRARGGPEDESCGLGGRLVGHWVQAMIVLGRVGLCIDVYVTTFHLHHPSS